MARGYAEREEQREFGDALVDFSAHLMRTEHERQGGREARVPCSHFWLLDGLLVLGTSRIRHRLTAALEREISHIGYDIRPTRRGSGYGSALLRLTLERAREQGLCGVDRLRLAERWGARLYDELSSDLTGGAIRRYWVAL